MVYHESTTIGCYRCYVHGHGTTPYLWFTINFFVAYQRISDDEDRMILRWSVFVLPAPTVDGSTLPKLIGRLCPLSISPCDRLEGIVKPSVSRSVNDHDEDEDENTAVVMIILRSLCLLHQAPSPDNITHVVMVDYHRHRRRRKKESIINRSHQSTSSTLLYPFCSFCSYLKHPASMHRSFLFYSL